MRLLVKQVKVFGGGMKRVEFFIPRIRGKDVLDLGVVQHTHGAYDLPNWLHRHVVEASASCLGLDIDKDGVSFLSEQGLNVTEGDAQNLQLGSQTFDAIVAGDVVEHLEDPRGFFEGVKRHLRPDGELLIATANPWFFVRFIQACFGKVQENPDHPLWYTPGTLTVMLGRHGFTIEHVEYGSSEKWLYRCVFLPHVIRHTGFWMVAKPIR